tara:strand:+ start:796 stop:1422 length:627 start_codon:yes stop_codon:yes gene_type:complete
MQEEMKQAVKSTVERMQACLDTFSSFSTEQEVKNFLQKDLVMAFPPIIASGKHAAQPHYEGSEKLEKGFCVIDFGVKIGNQCADMTRTVFIGTPSQEETQTYNELLREHHRLLRMVKPGMSLQYLDRNLRNRLGKNNKRFIHYLGHGIGKEVHEKVGKKLKETDVITIEPGLYEQGKWGIRIEDMITAKGEVLTKEVTKKLLVFPLKS